MKKLNKFFAILVALAMLATLCVSMAFAAPAATTDQQGTAANSVITKYLEIPSGETLPDSEVFTFTFTPVSDSAHNGTDHLPSAATAQIPVSAMTPSASSTDGNGLIKSINIADLFKYTAEEAADLNGVNAGDYKFPHAGEYIYTVAETSTAKADWTYDNQTYKLHIIVTNDATSGKPVISTITVQKGTSEDADKVDPTVTDPTTENQIDETWDELTNATAAGFTFVNKYAPEADPVNPDPDDPVTPDPDDPTDGKYGALGVTKNVDANGSKEATFPFTITVNVPQAYHGAPTVEAYIYTGETKGNTVQTITYGTPFDFNLSDGQSLIFERLPEGATYTVTERLEATTSITDWANYTPGATVLDAGTAVANLATASKAHNYTPLNTALEVNADGQGRNVAAFTNTRDQISPTGILINNLPYIALALVAIGGLVAYVVVRRRQDNEA